MKNMKKILALLLAALLLLSVVTGCAQKAEPAQPEQTTEQTQPEQTAESEESAGAEQPEDEQPESKAVTVTDMTGHEITLDEPATRIVALTPSDCEILYAIGAGDTIVGRGKYCDYPAEVQEITAVESGADTNLEQIIALQPQLLIMSTMAQTDEQVQQLEAAGIRVAVSDAQDIAGVYTAIEMIGELVGKQDEAAQLIDSMKQTFAAVSENAGDGTKSIYFEVSPLELRHIYG